MKPTPKIKKGKEKHKIEVEHCCACEGCDISRQMTKGEAKIAHMLDKAFAAYDKFPLKNSKKK